MNGNTHTVIPAEAGIQRGPGGVNPYNQHYPINRYRLERACLYGHRNGAWL